MRIFLPQPYPDELLYSVISRYEIYIGGYRGLGRLSKDIFGRLTIASWDLPARLSVVADRTSLTWQMDAEDIARKLTLLPYYTRYAESRRKKECLNLLISHDVPPMGTQAKTRCKPKGLINTPQYLRICPVCRNDDLAHYGETYWHRVHQIPGVLICPHHGEPLMNSSARIHDLHRLFDYADATSETVNIASNNVTMNRHDRMLALQIARRCLELLEGDIPMWSRDMIPHAYKLAATVHVLQRNIKTVSNITMYEEYISYYGTALLQRLGLDPAVVEDARYFYRMFHANGLRVNPISHVLLQLFLENTHTAGMPLSKIIMDESGSWACPRPHLGRKPYPISEEMAYLNKLSKNYLKLPIDKQLRFLYYLCDAPGRQ